MDSGIDKLKSVDWRGLIKTATNKVKQYTLNLSPLELKVEDATNMETWGPHGSVMSEISEACFDPEGYRQVLGVIARRLQEKDEHWRMCYKALLLLEHLIKHGPMKVAQDVSASMSVMDRLQRFQYKDDNGKDHGANVRHRAQEIVTLVTNPDRLREEREKAKVNRDKYRGVSAAEMRMGGFRGGGSSSYSGGSSGHSNRFDPASLQRPGGGGGDPYSSSGSGAMSGFSRSSRYDDGRDDGGNVYSTSSPAGGRSGDYSHTGAGNPGHVTNMSVPNSTASHIDAVNATRARIEKLKVSGTGESRVVEGTTDGDKKKKLTDIKVNPKIAASLGLKLPAPGPITKPASSSSNTTSAASQPPSDMDLLGGLMDDAPDVGAPQAPPAGFADFDAFGSDPPASSSAVNGSWDAFGGSHGGANALDIMGGLGSATQPTSIVPAAPAAAPVSKSAPLDLDLFAGLGDTSTTTPPMSSSAGQGLFDPFATMTSVPPVGATTAPINNSTATGLQFSTTAGTSPPSPVFFAKSPPKASSSTHNNHQTTAGAAVGVPALSSGDAFAELTGIHKAVSEPMGGQSSKGNKTKTHPPPLSSSNIGSGGPASPTFAAFTSMPAAVPTDPAPASSNADPFAGLL